MPRLPALSLVSPFWEYDNDGGKKEVLGDIDDVEEEDGDGDEVGMITSR